MLRNVAIKVKLWILDLIWGIMLEAGRPNVVDFFPIFRKLDPQGARSRMNSYFIKLISFFDGLIEERLRLRSLEKESKECNDVLDSVLELMLEENSQISRLHISHLFLDLFVAGIDTTASTIEWAMTELLRNPKVQEKVREELQLVFAKGEQLEESNISKLPFLRAVVKETLRLHPPAPFLVPHNSSIEAELGGFMVPKSAQILVNVWAMGRDSSIWTNPNEFMPERFLESGIDFKGQDFELIPFGAGRRICPGLSLAFRTVHIVLASLLFDYDWKLMNGQKSEDVDVSEKFGITLNKAQPLQIIPIKV
ncbi:geraniol 8-hydroxylase-like isoform X2 [Abrus precatorius]|uniref:Geraniol 8-hydroxylase-like isoform X2 n=1 Tax=Abrus precatorius TaxID=3816 RepID=A0A8B8JUM6_ABRPR|nr:geraniol 8-hydroxylase-like isoform X2 [Abrus precatorius]